MFKQPVYIDVTYIYTLKIVFVLKRCINRPDSKVSMSETKPIFNHLKLYDACGGFSWTHTKKERERDGGWLDR